MYEYIGEIYDHDEFQRRKVEYNAAGINHLYFMNLDAELVRWARLAEPGRIG